MASARSRRPAWQGLTLATRGSPLARWQAERVAELLRAAHPGLAVRTLVVRTRGDVLAGAELSRIGGQGAFTTEVQAAVTAGEADVAVHSAKDLPSASPPALWLAAVPERGDPRDALVGCRLADLPPGAVVATGSARRRAQLANVRPDLTFVEGRGNIGTRLRRVEEGRVHAVVVARAALDRLGWGDRTAEVLSPSVMLPQVGQGSLAVECRADDQATRSLLAAVDDPWPHRALVAERSLLRALAGSCTVPVAGFAVPVRTPPGDPGGPREMLLEGMVASGDGRVLVRASSRGTDPETLGVALARRLLDQGGGSSVEGWSHARAPSGSPGGTGSEGEVP